ncbi:MAG: hypothetical protein ABL953_02505 [Ilumatobacteraceae bacterium]
MDTAAKATVELAWIPLGAGQRVVKASGKIFEAASAWIGRRPRCDLYHSALIVRDTEHRVVIEMTPVVDDDGAQRGVVAEGAVGMGWLGRFRIFRYEIRRWRNGIIPDLHFAVSVFPASRDPECAQRVLHLVPSVPTPVWGRDELRNGEMWNSNSVTAWLLVCSGVDVDRIAPPNCGRAPGWDAGVAAASRRLRTEMVMSESR